jgi:hypothetical protein
MIKYEFGNTIDRKTNKLIVRLEEKLMKSIKIKIDFFLKNNNMKGSKRTLNILNTFNPLTSHLYYKNSFSYIKCFLSKEKILKNKFFNFLILFIEKYIETQEQNLLAKATGYNEEDERFVNNIHISRISKKKDSILYDYQQGLTKGIISNFDEYNQKIDSNQKKKKGNFIKGNLQNLTEENLISGEIIKSNSISISNSNNSENIDKNELKKFDCSLDNGNKMEKEYYE